MHRDELLSYVNGLLDIDTFRDYCPNGLQVEGTNEVQKIVTGVTASQALIEAAIAYQADALFVHHGYFWKGESQPITGMKKMRIQALLNAELNLFAYHLPLDAHPALGNNATLCELLEWQPSGILPGSKNLVVEGAFAAPQSGESVFKQVESKLQRSPQYLAAPSGKEVRRWAVCTGAAQSYLEQVAQAGIDLFISGEISEQTYHIVQELDVHFVAAGHHATERGGVRALGNHLAEKFGLEHEFIDIHNPV